MHHLWRSASVYGSVVALCGVALLAPSAARAEGEPELPSVDEEEVPDLDERSADDSPALPSPDEEEVPSLDGQAEGPPEADEEASEDDQDGEEDANGDADEDGEPETTDIRDWLDTLPVDLSLRLEGRVGSRLDKDPAIERLSLAETRLQLHLEKQVSTAELKVVTTTDFLLDSRGDLSGVDLQRGTGLIDLRQAYLGMRPFEAVSLKVGRQIITWGTGDLLFINDLFPKDWRSFLLGRDLEYLKAPSDAARVDLAMGPASLDVVFTPQFDPDRFITGERLVFFDGARLHDDGEPIDIGIPDRVFEDVEVSGRARLAIASFEAALYGYHGFWKSPFGFDPTANQAIFPPLSVFGASLRGPLLGTLLSLEGGYYLSEDDTDGTNPFVPNSEIRALIGLERSFGAAFTASVQGYLESMQAYDEYLMGLPAGFVARDQNRAVVTARGTFDWAREQVRTSAFVFFSPTDNDAYVRYTLHWGIGRFTAIDLGANLFFGQRESTFFGQHQKNSNVYSALRFTL